MLAQPRREGSGRRVLSDSERDILRSHLRDCEAIEKTTKDPPGRQTISLSGPARWS
jgi:hypothetical protein